MKSNRKIFAASIMLIIFIFVGFAILYYRASCFPDSKRVMSAVDAFMLSKGYREIVEKNGLMLRTPLPFSLRLLNINKHGSNDMQRRTGLGNQFDHGWLKGYKSNNDKGVEVVIECSGNKTFRIYMIAEEESFKLFSMFADQMKEFQIPMSVEGRTIDYPAEQEGNATSNR